MAYEFKTTRRVEFSDTDMAGIMHFSKFFQFMETAEHAFFRSLGFSIDTRDLQVGWPRVDASCQYKAPLRFEDVAEIHLLVAEKKEKSIRYQFLFKNEGVEVARGSVTTVCVKRDEQGKMRATAIPQPLASLIEEAPAELLEQFKSA